VFAPSPILVPLGAVTATSTATLALSAPFIGDRWPPHTDTAWDVDTQTRWPEHTDNDWAVGVGTRWPYDTDTDW
jgi:hypothetical protein